MLPNLCLLSTDSKEKKQRSAAKQRVIPYKKEEVSNKETVEKFHALVNNCAAYVLKVFRGFVECPMGLLWKYAPTRCQPIAGTVADVPDDAEQQRIISILLKGAPAFIKNFKDLIAHLENVEFTAFALSTAPNKEKIKFTSTNYHAMIGLVFENEDFKWGVTFGAYPTGELTDGSCTTDCSSKVVVVLGDQIAPCAREKFPREMRVRARVPGAAIKKQIISELSKLV